jgi:hypothetical protein
MRIELSAASDLNSTDGAGTDFLSAARTAELEVERHKR